MTEAELRAASALRLGDDGLILSHRLAEWSSLAPELEEDVALTNIALDLLGQARMLLTHAGELEGHGRDEDGLAYLRDEREFVNCLLVEQENGDFAVTIARQLLYSTHQLGLLEGLLGSTDPTLAAVAAKAVKEVAYHRDHAVGWTLRLGDGTEESHRRMQSAVDRMWPYAAELFETDEVARRAAAAGVAPDPAALRPAWDAAVGAVLVEATLTRPEASWAPSGGRRGLHTECFGRLIAEMQHLHRSHAGARW
ncbi:MAG TPA: 1,2-phenylacetyl-CoA epoxidase subunit PaaC [Candidatus Dormibacteraeota bacterium]|nr:1,2-phenylacetyl-CoA epoxidase subunit PaaC [Candidatus Dormibacteraeota bacterium]